MTRFKRARRRGRNPLSLGETKELARSARYQAQVVHDLLGQGRDSEADRRWGYLNALRYVIQHHGSGPLRGRVWPEEATELHRRNPLNRREVAEVHQMAADAMRAIARARTGWRRGFEMGKHHAYSDAALEYGPDRNPCPGRRSRRSKNWSTKPIKGKPSAAEIAATPGYEDALKQYKKFHGKLPKNARVIRIDDGNPGTRNLGVWWSMGTSPEESYSVPKGSGKTKLSKHWVHEFKVPPEILSDPSGRMTLKVPKSNKTRISKKAGDKLSWMRG